MIKERDGSQKAFETQAKSIISRSQGVPGVFFQFRGSSSDSSMACSGKSLQIKGELLANDRVRWQFHGADAWTVRIHADRRPQDMQKRW